MAQATAEKLSSDTGDDGTDGKTPLKLWLRLLSCSTLLETELNRRLRARFDTSLAKFDFMAQLARVGADGMTMSQLGQLLMVTGGNITGFTDRLEREGLASRRPHPSDRRSQVIALTDKGRENFERMATVHEGWIQELMGDLREEEMDLMLNQLGDLKDAVAAKLGNRSV